MECKFVLIALTPVALHRINRYIMECKLCLELLQEKYYRELIDTLWNVNVK